MLRLLRLFNYRHLRRRPLETALCLLGIAIGVAVMLGIDLANENALASFRRSVEVVTGRATHQIVGGPNGIADTLAARVLRQPLLQAAPVIEYVASCREANRAALHLLGVDPFFETPFRDYSAFAPTNAPASFATDALQMLLRPNAALVSESFLRRHGLAVGDTLHVLVGSEFRELLVQGKIPDARLARLGYDDLAVCDLATAQEILGRIGFVDRLDVIAGRERLAALRASLPPGLQIVTPSGRTQRVDDMLRSFRLNLTALSFLAVFVGMFLIYNTMLFTVIHRRKQLGILRCLGVTPKRIMATALLEALTLGVIGALLGLALGIVLAQYTTQAVSKTISELYVFLKFEGVTLRPILLLKAFGFGMLATLVATAVPAFEAASTTAATAVRRSSLESRAGKWAPRFIIFGCVWLLVAALFYVFSENFWGGLLVALSVGFAAICFTPSLSIWLTQRLAPASRKYAGQPGLLATRGIRAALSRTAVAIAALMLSLAMLLGMRLMITSFRATITAWVNHILEGDVYLSASGIATAKWQAKIAPEAIAELEQDPEVEAVDRYGVTEFSYRGRPIYLIAISAEVVQERLHFLFSKNAGAENWQRVRGGEAIISETFARRFRKAGGDTLMLTTRHGPRVFAIADVFIDYSFEQGQVMMDHATYEQHWGPSHANNLGVFLKPSTNAEAYLAKLRHAFAGRYAVRIVSNRELRAEVRRIFDQSFALTHVMQALTAIVAFVGIISAVMSLLVERTRELGILRAVGMSLAQLRRMVLLESGLMGLIAGVIALPTGSLFALVLVYVINLRTFDWTIALQWEPLAYVQTFALAVLTALLAAIYPLLRLEKIPIAGALREE